MHMPLSLHGITGYTDIAKLVYSSIGGTGMLSSLIWCRLESCHQHRVCFLIAGFGSGMMDLRSCFGRGPVRSGPIRSEFTYGLGM